MVSEAYAFRNGTDPAFYEEADIIKCNLCPNEYDYKEYRSFVCFECESEGK